MRASRPLLVGLALAALIVVGLLAIPAPASAQQKFCGTKQVQLRFHNPDLNPWNNPVPDGHSYHQAETMPAEDANISEASWQFFIQFQAVVNTSNPDAPGLLEIKSFWFAFGPIKEAAMIQGPGQGPGNNCEKPWAPGVQLYSYRGDADPSDGFHVPINTTGVPDGTYAAAVYACTAQSYRECQPGGADGGGNPNLVAAAWTRAAVYNGEDSCNDAQCERRKDFIKPWPKILPGDGKFPDTGAYAKACDTSECLTIEFAERLGTSNTSTAPEGKAVEVWINGIERTGDLVDWTPPRYDNDLILGNDKSSSGHPLSDCRQLSELSRGDARICQKVIWGDGFALPLDQKLGKNDEVRVRAVDKAGNVAEKVIAFDDETRGGVIKLVKADVEATVEPKERRVRPGDAKTYEITLQNTGSSTAHTFPEIRYSRDADAKALEAKLSDNHVDVPPNGNATVTLTAGPVQNASEGSYGLNVVFDYLSGKREETAVTSATVVVDESAALSGGSTGGNGSDGGDGQTQAPTTLPSGFERQCTTQAELEVCMLYPGNFSQKHVDEGFTFEVQTAGAQGGHDASAGGAELTLQYLSKDGTERVAEDQSFKMTEKSTGVYRTDVKLRKLAPMLHAIFDSDKARVTMMLRQPSADTEGAGGQSIPGFGVYAATAAAGAAALVLRRRD